MATLKTRNANEAVMAPMVGPGVVYVWRNLESAGRSFVGVFGKNYVIMTNNMLYNPRL